MKYFCTKMKVRVLEDFIFAGHNVVFPSILRDVSVQTSQ